jgi:hypothetical protein
MNLSELQNNIIRQVLKTDDEQLLEYLNSIINKASNSSLYKLSDFEKTLIKESQAEYLAGKTISNDDVFLRNEKWLEK